MCLHTLQGSVKGSQMTQNFQTMALYLRKEMALTMACVLSGNSPTMSLTTLGCPKQDWALEGKKREKYSIYRSGFVFRCISFSNSVGHCVLIVKGRISCESSLQESCLILHVKASKWEEVPVDTVLTAEEK